MTRCWPRCPAGSTPRSPPPGGRRRPRGHRRAPRAGQEPAVLPVAARAAAAPWRTPTTPAGPPTCSASRSTSGTCPTASPPTSSTTSSPSTPPAAPRTRACAATRRSSSPRCWTGRVALGFDAVCTGHYARLVQGAAGVELHRAVDAAKDQSYVLGVLTRTSWAARSSRWAPIDQAAGARGGRRARPRGGRQAGQPRHLLHRRRRHRGLPEPATWASAPAPSSTQTGRTRGRPLGRHQFTVGQRRGLRLGGRPPTASRGTCCRSPR